MSENISDVKQIVNDDELNQVWGNANFGTMSKRDVVKHGLLKVAGGYYQGHTSKTILEELSLINSEYELTEKGRKYLFFAFDDGVDV